MAVNTSKARPYWGNGHYYAYTLSAESWSSAASSSQNSTLNELNGYLATVTSSGENDFITRYSYGGAVLPDDGFLAGTDVQSEGTWIWDAGPEDGTVFRAGSTNSGYTNWDSGQPNNNGNQDYLRIIANGYWGDVDPGDVSGYVTEWGKAGAEFTASISSQSNGFETGTAPTITIKFNRAVPSDYKDIRNNTPLIDIPISFGGTAILGDTADYKLTVSGGSSKYENGRLYVLGTSSVKLTFTPNNNDSWQAPRTITVNLQGDGSENIYDISGSTTSRVRLFDDEPQLSLGQGAYQFIRTPYTTGATYSLPSDNSGFNTDSDVLVFDANGINETESGLAAQGLYDSFAIRWETYIRIPEDGDYVFRTTTDDGSKLTLRSLDSSGTDLDSISHWNSNTTISYATKKIDRKKGDVVWLQFDYFVDAAGATANTAKLTWDRPNGTGGTISNEVVPASAMFLSKDLAQGLNRQESSEDTTSVGFQLFANKSTSSPIKIKLSSSSETANSTVGSTLAKRQTGGTLVDGDYAIVDDIGIPVDSSRIGLNGSPGTLEWQPTEAFGTLKNINSFDVQVLKDDFAENSESINLSLSSGSGYGVSNASQTIAIADDDWVLTLTPGQNPTEGGDSDSDLGWFTIKANKPAPLGGLVIRYRITGGTAGRGSDYTAPQATRSTSQFNAEDLVVLPDGASEARVYIAAIADAIREGSETLTLELVANVQQNDQGFSFQQYNIDSSKSQASLTINDSSADQPAVVITPADRTGLATVRAQLVNGRQQAAFEVRLSSQPQAAVTVGLSSTSGNISSTQLSFNSSNWTQPQRVTLTDLRSDQPTTVTATCSSSDLFYSGLSTSQRLIPSGWPSELQLSLWEGGGLVPSAPQAAVQAIGGSEGSNCRLGFELTLASPVVGQPVELFYQLSGSDGFALDGDTADAVHTPEASYRPLELRNGSLSGGPAYAEFSDVTTVSDDGEFSAAAWVRLDALTTETVLLEFSDSDGSNRILLGFDQTGEPQLKIWDADGALLLDLSADNKISLQEWNHLAFSLDAGGVARLYLNGEQAAQGQLNRASGLISTSRRFNSIGSSALASESSSALMGAVRGVGIWNACRSQEQIQASMLAANASGTGLVSAFSLNGTIENSVAGGPDVVLRNGTSNTAAFATTPFYGLQVPVNEASIGLPLVATDDLTAEGTERLTLTLLDGGRYSLGGASSATADLSDDDAVEVLFLTAGQTDGSGSELTWTSTSQFRVSEADPASGSSTRLGIRLNSQPQGNVTLRLEAASFSASELKVSNPADPAAQTLELEFTPETWAEVQELQLQGVDDEQNEGDTSQSLSFTLSSGDARYAALSPALSVLSVDDDTSTANKNLAKDQSATAPIASLSGPSRAAIDEAGAESTSFTVTLAELANEDTLLFLEVDPRLSQVLANDISVISGSGQQSLAGLTRFDGSAGGGETTNLDADGIDESASSFSTNGQSGDFSSTWSGYLYIPKTGSYNVSLPVQGGVRLSLNGEVVIDKLFDSQATWNTGNLEFNRGDFVAVRVDYQSFDTDAPRVALRWQRPGDGGTTAVDELVPAQYLSRTDGFSLLIPAGSSSGSITLRGVQDLVAEQDEAMAISLLSARGVELLITGQNGTDELQATLASSDREAISLAAGTVLTLGANVESSGDKTDAIATFTLTAPATIHRDRSTSLSGALTWTESGRSSTTSDSVVGLVAGHGSDLYQVLDSSVSLTLTSPLVADGSGGYLASFRLEDTNRGSVTIPSGTTLTYVDDTSGAFLSLVLSNNLTLQSGQSATGIASTIASKSSSLDPEAADSPLLNQSSAYVLPNASVVQLLDDDDAGLLFSLDASGNIPVDATRIELGEQGSGVTRYARLRSQPSDTVTVYLETADASEAVLKLASSNTTQAASRIALTFTPNNWQTPQAFTILPADDDLVDDNINVNIHSRSSSGDGFYTISEAGTLPFQVKDDDVAGVTIELQQSSISKAGNGAVNLRLKAQPNTDVSVKLVPSDGQFTINDSSIGRSETLVFTPDNWSTPQSVSLWAVDDQTTGEDISSSQLQVSTVSEDPRFNAISVDPVQIDIVDNDPPRAEIILVSDSSEEAKPGRFQIQLEAPAPQSAGSSGVLVNYTITQVNLDPGLGYGSTAQESISKITQSPGAISGQVRIAPGETSSDLIVVPIDDTISDSINKSFTVQLQSGEGYTLSDDSASNSASVQIINNDKPGIALLTTGDKILLKETGQSASYQLALLSQPKANVSVTISEQLLSDGNRQLGSSSTPFSKQIQFTPDNWYQPIQINLQAYDDGRIEDGSGDKQFTGIHGAQLKYSFSSADPDYDSSGNAGDHFTNLVQDVDVLDYELPAETANALQSSLTSLQEGIDSLSLPIVGSLDGKAGAGLRKFITSLANSVRQIGTPTPNKLGKLLSQEIAGALSIPESAVKVQLDMLGTALEPTGVAVSFTFADSYDIVSVPLAADFGLPGLGFQSQGSLDAKFNYDAALKLVFPRTGEIYLDTAIDPKNNTANTHLSAKFSTSLSDDFSLTGGLGFLQLDAVNLVSDDDKGLAGTGLDVSFDLDLSGDAGSDGLTLNELTSGDLSLEQLFQYQLTGDAAMSFGVTTSVNGSAAIPSFSFDLSSLLPLFDYSNQQEASAPQNATSFYFDNIKLDLGSFITDMLSPIVDGLDTILNPLYPIVDALYSDTQIFATLGLESSFDTDGDGHVTAIDLASWFADFYAKTSNDPKAEKLQDAIDATIDFLDKIKEVIDLVRDLQAMSEEGNFYVDYGSYELPTFSAADASASTVDDVDLDEDGATADLNQDTGTQADNGGSTSPDGGSSTFQKIMKQLDQLGFEIPLIDDPKNAIRLLLGQNVDLFTWTMPTMGMTSEVEKGFPIYPGIEGIIEGGFGVEANLGFGFDTDGLNQWKKSGFKANDAWKVFDGFYVADGTDPGTSQYVDLPEFSMDATMGAGLGLTALVVRSDITGGLEAAASFDLLDEGEVAGTSDGKIRGSEISRITNPLDLFELVGSLSAYLKASVQVGVDMGFYSIWDTVWQEKLAEIPLFEFGVGGSYGSGTVSNGYLQGSTVFWDGNHNLRIDPYEPNTITGQDAHYNLRVEHRSFDLNRNGSIDVTEGNLIAFGGVDTSTGLALEVPFLAPLGQMITPLTTLHSLAVAEGLDAEAAGSWIDQAFGLNGFDYLRRDPVLELKPMEAPASANQMQALAAYIAHIKLHFGWDVLVQSLQQLLSEQFPEAIGTELALITAYSKALLALPATTASNDRLATAALNSLQHLTPEPPVEVAPLAALAAALAANANWDLCRQIDALFTAVQQDNSSLRDSIAAIDQLKSDAFAHYRASVDAISQGLYRINDPAERANTVQQRLAAIYNSFVTDHPLQSGSQDGANGLIRLLDLKDWSLSGAARLTTTPFTTIQSLVLKGISLSDRQLDFGLRLKNNGAIAGADQPVSVLVSLENLGLPQRTADAALSYFVGIDLNPTPFLFDTDNRTGARFFDLGAGLGPVVELNHRDGQRGDVASEPGVIQAQGSVAELKQSQQLQSTASLSEISVVPSDATDGRPAAVFVQTELINRSASSNQYGYLVLRDDEIWDASAISIGELHQRIQILGGSLESSDLPQLSRAMNAQRDLQLNSGDRLIFLEMLDNILEDLPEADAPVASMLGERITILNAVGSASANSLRLQSSTSGMQLQIDLETSEPGLSGFLARPQSQAPLLDFSGLADMRIQGTLDISREAADESTAGFYQVLDSEGTVLAGMDPTTSERRFLRPSDGEAYRRAALSAENLVEPLTNLSIDNLGLSSRNLSIRAGTMLAPFAIVETGEVSHTYFAFKDANPDRIAHFQMHGDNVFMLEDRYGGGDRDFDDLLIAFTPTGIVQSAPI